MTKPRLTVHSPNYDCFQCWTDDQYCKVCLFGKSSPFCTWKGILRSTHRPVLVWKSYILSCHCGKTRWQLLMWWLTLTHSPLIVLLQWHSRVASQAEHVSISRRRKQKSSSSAVSEWNFVMTQKPSNTFKFLFHSDNERSGPESWCYQFLQVFPVFWAFKSTIFILSDVGPGLQISWNSLVILEMFSSLCCRQRMR